METVRVDTAAVNPAFSATELSSLAAFFDESVGPESLGTAIPAMFGSASSKLKHPKLHFTTPSGSEMVLKLATGQRTRYPDSVHVTLSGVYYASISPEGVLYSRRALPDAARTMLLRLAADPIAVTLEQGQMRGRCCFCRRSLSDSRSACHGYGARCAEIWGLKWNAPRSYRGMFGDAWSAVSGAELVARV